MWVVSLEPCSESLETYVLSWIDRSKDDIEHLLGCVIEERELSSQDCFFRAGMSLVDVHELRQTNALFYVRRTNRRRKYICSSVNTTSADATLKWRVFSCLNEGFTNSNLMLWARRVRDTKVFFFIVYLAVIHQLGRSKEIRVLYLDGIFSRTDWLDVSAGGEGTRHLILQNKKGFVK